MGSRWSRGCPSGGALPRAVVSLVVVSLVVVSLVVVSLVVVLAMTVPAMTVLAMTVPAVTSPGGPAADGIRVLIADDEALVRAGFRVLVDSAPDLHVVGEAADGIQAVRQARALQPDVVLMDIRMPIMPGLEATRVILDGDGDGDGHARPPRILIVTTFDEDEHVFEALRSGASGFLLKDTPPEQLLDAIRVIAGGDALLTPSITRRLIAEFARSPRPGPAPGAALGLLTEREREVLVQVAAGLSNAEIAGRLHLSIPTVKTHVSRLLSKLGGRDRAQLVVFAYEAGVTTPGRLAPPG
jgi:DNA-binding NarL/FixJ family response regulator